jgi:hypothetical protein
MENEEMPLLPNYKDIVELIRKGSTIEAQEKILELRKAAMQLQEENLALRQENKALKEALELRSRVIWEKPYYWVQSESSKEGPYCQHCYDAERKLIRLQGGNDGWWKCMACKNGYSDSFQQPPGPISVKSNKGRI